MEKLVFTGDPHVHVERNSRGQHISILPSDVARVIEEKSMDFAFVASHKDLPTDDAEQAARIGRKIYGYETCMHPTIEITVSTGRSNFHAALVPPFALPYERVNTAMTLDHLEAFMVSARRRGWQCILFHPGVAAGEIHQPTTERDVTHALHSPAFNGVEIVNGAVLIDRYPASATSMPLNVLQKVEQDRGPLTTWGGSDAIEEAHLPRIGTVGMDVRAHSVNGIVDAMRSRENSKVFVETDSPYIWAKIQTIAEQAPTFEKLVDVRRT